MRVPRFEKPSSAGKETKTKHVIEETKHVIEGVEAEVIEKLWATSSPEQMFEYVAAAIARVDWSQVLALLELEVGVAAARQTYAHGLRLLHCGSLPSPTSIEDTGQP